MSDALNPYGRLYPKIQGVFKRDADNRNVIMPGEFSEPVFELLLDVPWIWTEKIDGTNIRLHWDGARVHIGGRTNDAQIPTHLLSALERYTEPFPWAVEFPPDADVTVYGEGYGAKIQKGGGNYIADGQGFIVFDVRVGRWWLKDEDVRDVSYALGMEVVPTALERMTLRDAINYVADGALISSWPGVKPEGIVGRPLVDLYTRNGTRVVTKIKGKDFDDLRRLAA